MGTKNPIWSTGDSIGTISEFETTRNVELWNDPETGCIEVRVTSQTLTSDKTSFRKQLTLLEAIEMGIELIEFAKNQLILEE